MMTTNDDLRALTGDAVSLEARAREFATRHHEAVNHLRKYTAEPYMTHPAAVAEIVRGVPHTPEMIAAALLHDTVEDTHATQEDIEQEFGPEVGRLVFYLTDASKSSDGNRAARKTIDRAHIAFAPVQAKTVKLADLIDNARSIAAHDPNFAPVYMAEKAALLEVLRDADPTLWALANDIVTEFSRKPE